MESGKGGDFGVFWAYTTWGTLGKVGRRPIWNSNLAIIGGNSGAIWVVWSSNLAIIGGNSGAIWVVWSSNLAIIGGNSGDREAVLGGFDEFAL